MTYGELVPTSANGVVNGDLEEGNSLQFELGLRGKPLPYLNFDVSGFYYTFDDQVGEISLPRWILPPATWGMRATRASRPRPRWTFSR